MVKKHIVIILCRVVAGAKIQKILVQHNQLKCYIQSPPKEGRANQELLVLLAKRLQISRRLLSIVSGHTSKIKRIAIETSFSQKEIEEQLGIYCQLSFLQKTDKE